MASPTVDRRFGLVGNVAVKAPVRALAATNVVLSGTQTIDDVVLVAGDRVLCVGQTDSKMNGIWDVSASGWTRSVDANGRYDLVTGSMVIVTDGTDYTGTIWRISTTGTITIGSTLLNWVRALVAAASSLSFLQAGTGAEVRDAESKMRERVSILDFIPVTEHAAIKARTSTFDCYASIMEAINSQTFGTGINISGPAIYFPPGNYLCNSTIELKRGVRLYGDASGMPSNAGAASLTFPGGVTGIIVHRHNTIGATTAASTTGADGSIIEGLQLLGAYSATPDTPGGHGIWLRARAVIRNCLVNGFSGDQIRIIATAGGGGALEGNANGWRVDTVRLQNGGEWGLQVAGADVNAGIGIQVDTAGNGTGGIFDNSFLGNQYDAPQAATNGAANAGHNGTRGRTGMVSFGGNRYYALYPTATEANLVATTPGTDDTIWKLAGAGGVSATHPLWVAAQPVGTYCVTNQFRYTNANAKNLLNNPYQEGGYSASFFTNLTQINNGALNGITTGSWLFGNASGLNCRGQFAADTLFWNTSVKWLDTSALFNWELKSPGTGRYSMHWANVDRGQIIFYDRNATTGNGYARTIDVSAPGGNSGSLGIGAHYFGSRTQMAYWAIGNPPTSTAIFSQQGDIYFTSNPSSSGGLVGRICTVSGFPGTFRTFGAITTST